LASLNGNYAESLRNQLIMENISPGDWSVNYSVGCYASWLNKQKTVIETYAKFDANHSYYGSSDISEWRVIVLADAYHLTGNYKQEIVECLEGLKVYPDCLWLYTREVSALAAMGKTEELEDVISKCLSVSSVSGTVGDVMTLAALELLAHGNSAAAREYAIRAVDWYENQPAGIDFRRELARAFYIAGSWAEAKSLFAQLAVELPYNIDFLGYMGAIAAQTGDREEAEKVSDQLSRINRPYLFGQHIYWQARIAALLGEPGQAIKLLRESLANGKIFEIGIHNNPDFESLYNYEPFIELVRPKQ
jgi:tetratricopeptide (TPR) repeat protein